jgi:hypothetical protein
MVSGLEALGAKDVWEPKLTTLTSVEKQIGKEALEQFVSRTEAKTLLVTEDDKRPAFIESRREDLLDAIKPQVVPAIPADTPNGIVANPPEEKVETKSKAKGRGRPKGSTKAKAKAKAKSKAKAAPRTTAKRKRRTTRKTRK